MLSTKSLSAALAADVTVHSDLTDKVKYCVCETHLDEKNSREFQSLGE
jgi:hypothetical protein